MEQTLNSNEITRSGEGSQPVPGQTQMRQLIVFRMGKEEYGLAIDQVKEIVVMPSVARIPLMPPYVKGVANIRGNILAIIDLAEKFALADAVSECEEKSGFILVIEWEKYKAGLRVKEVPSTLTVAEPDIDQSPNIIYDGNAENNYIQGIIRQGSRLIILIDVVKAIAKDALLTAIHSVKS